MTTTATAALQPGQSVIVQTLYDGPQPGIVQAVINSMVLVVFARPVRFTKSGYSSTWSWMPRDEIQVSK